MTIITGFCDVFKAYLDCKVYSTIHLANAERKGTRATIAPLQPHKHLTGKNALADRF
jgi:hypothetical protein